MKQTFPGKVDIAFTDTDSFLLEITDSQYQEKLQGIKHWFDFSNYPKHSPLYSTKNKKVPGKYVMLMIYVISIITQ